MRLDKVDPFYLHNSHSRLGVAASDETRLKMNAQEVEEFAKEREGNAAAAAANFHTECWFLTLQAHHLSVLPCIRRFQRRLRSIREVNKIVDELERTKAQWAANPALKMRNETMLKRYKNQLRVRHKKPIDISTLLF